MRDRDRGPELSPREQDRNVESAVLAIVIERHPSSVSVAEVVDEMTTVGAAPGRAEATRRAIAELARVGLLQRRGEALEPTRASLRWAELETGLPRGRGSEG
jgi:hypothetical protein